MTSVKATKVKRKIFLNYKSDKWWEWYKS